MTNQTLILKDKKSIYIEDGVTFGKNVIIYPNNYITAGSVIGDNVTLLPGNFIDNSVISKGCKIQSSQIENSVLGEGCLVGPYAHLRPKCELKNNVKVGNFCELKNSTIGSNTKISHLSYVGDAIIGQNTNIGCGVVFANYNGKIKARSHVGSGCFIGSNSNIIAPVSIADNTYICAGTTVTQSTKEYDFVIGRVMQTNKPDYAKKYLKD